jgi:hypothetical protein
MKIGKRPPGGKMVSGPSTLALVGRSASRCSRRPAAAKASTYSSKVRWR